ncbi:MAG: prepilin-type N-terminal cleavage/methylation domain-containing protein [Phycisphaerae bacterium]|nr:prepilin-type N-terminal cleavage/methylation domain-containing protein [Phycisphaerae bacterium]
MLPRTNITNTRVTRTRAGFTLVELLVATTISSLLVVSIVSATRAISGARASVDRRISSATSARRALDEIVGALRNVRRDMVRGQPVVVGHGGGRDGDRIDIQIMSTRRSRPDGAESDQLEVGFFLAQLPRRQLPALMCRRDHGLDEHPDDGGIATVVAEGIVGLSFEYFTDGQWVSEWSELEPRAPQAVRVIVAAATPEEADSPHRARPVVLSTVVALHVNKPLAPPPPPRSEQASPRPTPGGPRG